MPTYEYLCKNCGHTFDILQSMKEEKLTKCPECGEEALQRLIGTGAGLIFKGSGFYLTDYVKKGEGGSAVSGTAKKETQKDSAANKESTPSKESTESTTAKSETAKDTSSSTKSSGTEKKTD